MSISLGTRHAWAIGRQTTGGFRVRRVVWGKLLASYEKRDGEALKRVTISEFAKPIRKQQAAG